MKNSLLALIISALSMSATAGVVLTPPTTTGSPTTSLPSSPLVVPSGTTMYGTASPTVAQCNQLVAIALGFVAQRTINNARPVLAPLPSATDNTVGGVLLYNTSLIADYIYTVGPLDWEAQQFVYNSCVQGVYKTPPVVSGGPTLVSPS